MRPLYLRLLLTLTESEHVGTALEGDVMEWLGQGVGRLILGGCVLHFDGVGFDMIANEEMLHFDVLTAIADTAVVCDIQRTLTVDEQCGGLSDIESHVAEVVPEP